MATAWLKRSAALALTASAFMSAFLVAQDKDKVKDPSPPAQTVAPPDSSTEGTVSIGGEAVAYSAVAGTITGGATEAKESTMATNESIAPDSGVNPAKEPNEAPATARMFYVAYFKKAAVSSH